jgi:lipoprotein-anchoring transpeptidase ErfK/SrfK
MSTTSLQHKTVRPGSLVGYSYYHSSRRAPAAARPAPQLFKSGHHLLRWGLLAAVILGVLFIAPLLRGGAKPASKSAATKPPAPNTSKLAPAAAPAATSAANHCAGNKQGELILVSISQRHLWACQGGQTAYDAPVVTGIDYLAADLTPTGTYHIYAKQTDLTLTGADSTGSWSDPVQYWMPFLHNQYGSYGFHDATWRAADAFGNISPHSADASHGCVELPLAASAWLYNWAHVGTTVTVKS